MLQWFHRSESVAWSGSGGLLLDASVTGGSISLDAEHNGALYGSGVSAAQVLRNPNPDNSNPKPKVISKS